MGKLKGHFEQPLIKWAWGSHCDFCLQQHLQEYRDLERDSRGALERLKLGTALIVDDVAAVLIVVNINCNTNYCQGKMVEWILIYSS